MSVLDHYPFHIRMRLYRGFVLDKASVEMLEVAARARSSMDRASDFGSEGWGFKSLRAHHYISSGRINEHQELTHRLELNYRLFREGFPPPKLHRFLLYPAVS